MRNDKLIIEPGVVIRLHNRSGFRIYGLLKAKGEETDPVIITKFQEWDSGSGLRFESSNGVLRNCIIKYSSMYHGGGVYCNDSSVALKHCVISDNSARHGGGIYSYASTLDIEDCLISRNEADLDWIGSGGGLYNYRSDPNIVNCTFEWNTAYDGGGIHFEKSSPYIRNCSFLSNIADFGGGVYCQDPSSPVLKNCIFSRNTGVVYGGGLRCKNDADAVVTNCTFTLNIGDDGGGIGCLDAGLTITNCILCNNWPDEIYVDSPSNPVVTYCDVVGGWEGTGNIDADPRFRSFGGFNYLLEADSPCIDSGHPDIEDQLYDRHPKWPDGRPDGARSNMGAYGGRWNAAWQR